MAFSDSDGSSGFVGSDLEASGKGHNTGALSPRASHHRRESVHIGGRFSAGLQRCSHRRSTESLESSTVSYGGSDACPVEVDKMTPPPPPLLSRVVEVREQHANPGGRQRRPATAHDTPVDVPRLDLRLALPTSNLRIGGAALNLGGSPRPQAEKEEEEEDGKLIFSPAASPGTPADSSAFGGGGNVDETDICSSSEDEGGAFHDTVSTLHNANGEDNPLASDAPAKEPAGNGISVGTPSASPVSSTPKSEAASRQQPQSGSPAACACSKVVEVQKTEIARIRKENGELTEEMNRLVAKQADVMTRLNNEVENERCVMTPRPGASPNANSLEIVQLRTKNVAQQEEITMLKQVVRQLEGQKTEMENLREQCKKAERNATDAERRRATAEREAEDAQVKIKDLKGKCDRLTDQLHDVERKLKKDRLLTRQSKRVEDTEEAKEAAVADAAAQAEASLRRVNERLTQELTEMKCTYAWAEAALDRVGISAPSTWFSSGKPADAPPPEMIKSAVLRLDHLELLEQPSE